MRTPTALVLCMMIGMILAGCTSSTTRQESSNVIVPSQTRPGGTLNASGGEVQGFVLDQFDTPVPGANVVLLGTAYFDLADDKGHYKIDAVAPGTYRLSASRENYSNHAEVAVEVALGLITRANISMMSEVSDAGGRPHRHDWWGADSDVVVMDRDLNLDGLPVCAGGVVVYGCSLPGNSEYRIYFRSDADPAARPNIVFQGTGKLSLSVTVGTMVGPMEVHVKAPTADATRKILLVDGGTDSVELDVDAADWDASHFRTSQWYFELTGKANALDEPSVAQGPIHFKVTVKRGSGEVPLETAHPDYWGSETQERLMAETCNYIFFPGGVGYVTQNSQPKCPNGPDLPTGKTVRSGTGVVRVTLEYQNALPAPVKFGLLYMPASSASWHEVPDATTETLAATPGAKETRTFEIATRPEQWDSPYAGTKDVPSRWSFFVYVVGPLPPNAATGSYNSVFSGDVKFTVDIFKQV